MYAGEGARGLPRKLRSFSSIFLQGNDRRETPALAGEGVRGLPRKLRSFSSIFLRSKKIELSIFTDRELRGKL